MQVDGVAMGPNLGPAFSRYTYDWVGKLKITRINRMCPILEKIVDDTISFVKLWTINYISRKLNSFDDNIQFTFEEEVKEILSFLDVLVKKG